VVVTRGHTSMTLSRQRRHVRFEMSGGVRPRVEGLRKSVSAPSDGRWTSPCRYGPGRVPGRLSGAVRGGHFGTRWPRGRCTVLHPGSAAGRREDPQKEKPRERRTFHRGRKFSRLGRTGSSALLPLRAGAAAGGPLRRASARPEDRVEVQAPFLGMSPAFMSGARRSLALRSRPFQAICSTYQRLQGYGASNKWRCRKLSLQPV
jgi:hypothetical protein